MTRHHAHVEDDALLGIDWVPFAEAICRVNAASTRSFWRLQFVARDDETNPPFLQATQRAEGLHLEIGGHPSGKLHIANRDAALRLAGWIIADEHHPIEDPDERAEFISRHPLPFRAAPRELRDTEDLLAILRTLAITMGVDPYGSFSFGGDFAYLLKWCGVFANSAGEVFALRPDWEYGELPTADELTPPTPGEPAQAPVPVPLEPDPGSVEAENAEQKRNARAPIAGRLTRVNFSGARLHAATFSGAALERCSFASSDLTSASFAAAVLDGSKFTDARIGGIAPLGDTDETTAQRLLTLLSIDGLRVPYIPWQVPKLFTMPQGVAFGSDGRDFSGLFGADAFVWLALPPTVAWADYVFLTKVIQFGERPRWLYSVRVGNVGITAELTSSLPSGDPLPGDWNDTMGAIEAFMEAGTPLGAELDLHVVYAPDQSVGWSIFTRSQLLAKPGKVAVLAESTPGLGALTGGEYFTEVRLAVENWVNGN